MENLEAVIGLEIHAQISSKTKMFCGCDNDSFGKAPNLNVCPICMGFPGMLPVINKSAIEKGVIAAMALKCTIPKSSKFDRKNYFYPDLPSGFQISQFDEPVAVKGEITINVDGKDKKIGITRLHLENDAGKLTHTSDGTLLDFNRAGTPLMEIVSEPDMENAQEAKLYAEQIQKILRYCGSSDCDMEKGMMRFDASVSIRRVGEKILNPRAEIKNLNSFKSLHSAISYEIDRQKQIYLKGEKLSGDQTVGWDEEKLITKLLREKESAADYRYFPEPDLPPLHTDEEDLDSWRKKVPELPSAKFARLRDEYSLSPQDAEFYVENPKISDYFEFVAKSSGNSGLSHSFVSTILVAKIKGNGIDIKDSPINAKQMAELVNLINDNVISNNIAKSEVFELMWESGESALEIVEKRGLSQVSDSVEIEKLCNDAITENPKAAEDVMKGEMKAIGALVGAVLKKSQGKANPKIVNDILKNILL